MKKLILLFTIILLLISCQKHDSVRIILIGIDALSTDGIQSAKTPNLNRLIHDGAFTLKARGVMPTVSAPNWGSMLTGAGPEQHGITKNGWKTTNYTIEATIKDGDGYFPSIFQIIKEQKPILKTAMFYDWKELLDLYNPKNIDKIEFASDYNKVYEKAINFIKNDLPDFTFIYVGHVDEVGHEFGHGTEAYYKSIEEVDLKIGELLNTLDLLGIYESTNIIVISDHGGVGHGHGGDSMDEIQIPWIIKGPGVIQNRLIEEPVNTYNTAPTIAYLFNIKQPDQWLGQPVLGALSNNDKSSVNNNSYLPKPKASINSGIYDSAQLLNLTVNSNNASIRYTLDGSEPNEKSALYSTSIKLDDSEQVKAIAISGEIKSEITSIDFKKVISVKNAILKVKPSPKYPAELNGYSLIDGELGNDDYTNSAWMGFEFDDFEAVLDFGKVQMFNKVSLNCIENKSSWIFLPTKVEFYASNDNINYHNIGNIDTSEIKSPSKRNVKCLEKIIENSKWQYLKVIAKNIRYCPKGHAGEGKKAWLFVDEVMVE